ncbi:MAG TPA: polymer-forming cytoskeletal protein [Kiloniellales bacterium]
MFSKGESATSKSRPVRHSVLPAGTTLKGDLIGSGDITIEGTVDGNIKCRFLTLSGQPTISGSAEAELVHLCGSFTGELRANKVILQKNARMRGDIYQEILEVQPGADFEGKVAPLRSSRAKSATKSRGPIPTGQEPPDLPAKPPSR